MHSKPTHFTFREFWRAAAWGLALILAPLVVLPFLFPIWLFREPWRFRRSTSWIPRYLLMAAIITAGFLAPLKWEDQKIGLLPSRETTLGELRNIRAINHLSDGIAPDITLTLPSPTPSHAELAKALGDQTPFKIRIRKCYSGGSNLLTSPSGFITLTPRYGPPAPPTP